MGTVVVVIVKVIVIETVKVKDTGEVIGEVKEAVYVTVVINFTFLISSFIYKKLNIYKKKVI